MSPLDLTARIEALIFASDVPLSIKKIRENIEDAGEKEIREALHRLAERYEAQGSAIQVIEIAGGYQMVTRSEFAHLVSRIYQSNIRSRLTGKGLETLAIIAYNQPVTKPEIEKIRGVNVDGVMRTLIERNLITVRGRKKEPGNPLLYGTTRFFLEYFGLRSLDDLPKLKEIDELLKGDRQFLESLDQVSLQEILPEELGLKFMEKENAGGTTSTADPENQTTDENRQEKNQNDTSE